MECKCGCRTEEEFTGRELRAWALQVLSKVMAGICTGG